MHKIFLLLLSIFAISSVYPYLREMKKPLNEWIDRKNPVYLSFFSPLLTADYKWNSGQGKPALEQSRLAFYRSNYLRDGGVSRAIQHFWIAKAKQAIEGNSPSEASEPLSLLIQSGDFHQWAPLLSKWIEKRHPDKSDTLRFPLLNGNRSLYFNMPMHSYSLPLKKDEGNSQKAILELSYLHFVNSGDLPKEGNLFILPINLSASSETPASIIVELSSSENLNGAFVAVNSVVPKWKEKGNSLENMLILENIFRREWKVENGISIDRIFIYLPSEFHGKITDVDVVPFAGILY